MRVSKTQGIIIKRRNYSEADRILTIFTQSHGKIHVKASGIRRIPSRRSAHVELLNYALLTLYKGNGMAILTEAHTLENFSNLKNDLAKIGQAYHLCELIDGLCPENQENTKVFELLKDQLTRLSANYDQSNIQAFEIDLLTALGFWSSSNTLTANFNTRPFIENILERKLKSQDIFSKLQ